MEVLKLRVGPLRTNCYLIISNGEAIVVDPGDDKEVILAELVKHSAKLLYVVNTHYHFDHTAANDDISAATGAKILIHEAEKEYIDWQADQWLQDGDEIKFGNDKLKVVHTPGHTAGGICLLGENVIFTGDTLFKGLHGRTDFDGGSPLEMEKSLTKLKDIIKSGMHVYPGHGHDYVEE